MRKLWVYTLLCAASMALGATFLGVASSAASEGSASLKTGLSGTPVRTASVAEQVAPKPASLVTSAAPKRLTPPPNKAGASMSIAQARAGAGSTRLRSASARTGSRTSELQRAQSILADYIAQHPILKGTTVSFGDAQGYQAISYYKSGRIVISSTHTVSIDRILAHEIWHVIDWRDNGRIDWGENVPPR